MERLSNTNRPSGFTCRGLRTWGLLLTLAGIVSRGLLQNRILGLGTVSNQQLLELFESSDAMVIATAALAFQLLETCAVPIFAWLLVKGAEHTSNLKNYALRIAVLAVVSELPYNLAIGGQLTGYPVQNPVYGLLLALVMLIFFRQYEGKQPKAVAIKLVVFLAAMVWTSMFRIDNGGAFVLITAALWLSRSKPMMQSLFGAAAAMLCSLGNLFFMASPMVFLAIHFCNGERGEQNRLVNYLAYPVMLLAVGLGSMFLL